MKKQIISDQTGLRSFSRWLQEEMSRPSQDGEWRKRGWITTINIAGRQYVTSQAVADFNRRAEAGEFAADHPTPVKKTENTLLGSKN